MVLENVCVNGPDDIGGAKIPFLREAVAEVVIFSECVEQDGNGTYTVLRKVGCCKNGVVNWNLLQPISVCAGYDSSMQDIDTVRTFKNMGLVFTLSFDQNYRMSLAAMQFIAFLFDLVNK